MRIINLKFLILIFFIIFGTDKIQAQISNRVNENAFKVKPVVSLIVSGEDMPAALDALEKAVTLSKKVKVINVLIAVKGEKSISFSSALSGDFSGESLSSIPQSARLITPELENVKYYIHELKLYNSGANDSESLITKLRLSYSPTWIVRYEGKDYVYEGFKDISKFFTRTGEFNQ